MEQANEEVVRKVGTGKMTPANGQIMSEILEKRRRVIETGKLQWRIEELERIAQDRKAA